MGGRPNAYEQGVLAAVQASGVQPGTPLMLVGHSQGGLVAARAASGLSAAGYRVTDVLTAGAPIGGVAVPAAVQVLAVENTGDLVPEVDGLDNPARANVTDHGPDRSCRRHRITRSPFCQTQFARRVSSGCGGYRSK